MKKIVILGSTGSIGTQTLDVIKKNSDLQVAALSANKNIEKLEEQIRQFSPPIVCVYEEKAAAQLAVRVADCPVKIVSGMEGLEEIASMPGSDIVVTAVVGMIGIRPTIAAIRAGKDIALANKETLVTAGHIIMPLASEYGVKILPVDSEHSAIFQALNGENPKQIHKILLTASGGPFRGMKKEELEHVTLEQALHHPNWAMGKKITIDSATMVNKGLELIEARWLFDVSVDQVQIIVQPQSLIHSMVEFEDRGIMAQMGTPDMRLPIQYALFYPQRRYLDSQAVDFTKLGSITFEKPDMDTFYALRLAYEAGRRGGSLPTVLNAANELAVSLFLQRKISFVQITQIIQQCMENHKIIANPTLEEILSVEKETYELVEALIQKI